MSSNVQQSIWDALAMGEDSVRELADASAFNWKASHPKFGSPVHAIIFGIGFSDDEEEWENEYEDETDDVNGQDQYGTMIDGTDRQRRKRLVLLQHALESGADPHIVAPNSCNRSTSFSFWVHGDWQYTDCIDFAGKTAVECVLAGKRVLLSFGEKHDASLVKHSLETVETVLSMFWRRRDGVARVSVAESMLDIWASVMADTSESDVSIRVKSAATLRAHSVVLRAASPVLSAMLSGTMREGSSRQITIEEYSIEVVELLLSLIYTGSLPADSSDPKASLMLKALSLAHCWQVQHAVEMLANRLAKRLDIHNFERVLSVALRLELISLVRSCRTFVGIHRYDVQRKMRENTKACAKAREEVCRILHCAGSSGASQCMQLKRRRVF
eukprot:TRINITY_DN48491_c0_g1_i1.p1 TRINITY_DN48491_c0_g1~~TRINITY_DN48491_c0_g1_i1.p1  ORF type:complete len:386 (-),score=41.42 TRINITY_DN48491_c0_g1_i1:207-1364(-)